MSREPEVECLSLVDTLAIAVRRVAPFEPVVRVVSRVYGVGREGCLQRDEIGELLHHCEEACEQFGCEKWAW